MNPLRNLCSLKCFLILTILITEHEVSDGPDGITPKIPKLVSTSMCNTIIKLFNK